MCAVSEQRGDVSSERACGFAHGKVILLGEHSVVYGHPALCGALAAGVTITAVAPADPLDPGALCVPAWGLRTPGAAALLSEPPHGTDVATAYAALLQVVARSCSVGALQQLLRCDLSATFAIPTGAGLGSSAALAVAAARALDGLLRGAGQGGLSAEDIACAALAAETVFHGRPSGLDHTVAQHGGFGLFQREGAVGRLAPLLAPAVPLIIGQTGRARDTRGRVARVAELRAQQPEETRARFAQIEALVAQAAQAVRAGDLTQLGSAMNQNQEALQALEVSCPEIDAMCALARGAGALGAKLTGGGGGGCVLAVAAGEAERARVQAAWREAGFASFLTQVGGAVPA